MKLPLTVSGVIYNVKIPLPVFRALLADPKAYASLCRVKGVIDIEYSGHYGPYVWFTASTDAARDRFIKRLTTILKRLEKRLC